jgi:hypothetical protein
MLDAFNGGGTNLSIRVLVKDAKTGRMATLYRRGLGGYVVATSVDPGAGIPAASNDVLYVQTDFILISHPRFYHPTNDDDDESPFSLGCSVGWSGGCGGSGQGVAGGGQHGRSEAAALALSPAV